MVVFYRFGVMRVTVILGFHFRLLEFVKKRIRGLVSALVGGRREKHDDVRMLVCLLKIACCVV